MKNSDVGEKIISDFEWYYTQGLITPRDGNACVRTSSNEFLITPSGVQKQNMNLNMLVRINSAGELIEPSSFKPSIETAAHLIAMELKSTPVSVHVHSLNTVALFSLATKKNFLPLLEQNLRTQWPELFRYTKLGNTVPFLSPGSHELHEAIRDSFTQNTKSDIIVLDRHGIIATGESLEDCKEHIQRLEHISDMTLKMLMTTNLDLDILK